MKILSAEDMRATDAASVALGVGIEELMEGAGEAVAAFVLRHYPDAARVMVLCGKGNNGGDGLVAARLLAGEGVGVRVLLAGRVSELTGAARGAMERLKEATSEDIVEEFSGDEEGAAELLEEADLIVDAVVGTGFMPPLRGAAAALRDAVAGLGVPVVAVDLPSGWDADSEAETADGAFRADAVVTFTAPKRAHVFGHLTTAVDGAVVVAEIGTPAEAVVWTTGLRWTGTARELVDGARPINSNKGKFGHVMVAGGALGTAGAPAMAALACLRAGAGLVTAAVPRSVLNTVARVTPELMCRALMEDENGAVTAGNLETMEEMLRGIKVVALGPGLSTRGEASVFARGVVAGTTVPMVVDADALNAFTPEHSGLLDGRGRTLVLTPHPGEFARLLGRTVAEVEADRMGLARKFALEHGVTLVLKGWRTLVAHPDGSVAVNTTGNPGLAKGGSGDTLTGIVAALLAQQPENVAEAVEAAVYLHGLAADLAVVEVDEKALLATDVTAHLSAAFRARAVDEDGLVYISGLPPRGDHA